MIRLLSSLVLTAMVTFSAPGSGSAQAQSPSSRPGPQQGQGSGQVQGQGSGRGMTREEREAALERIREANNARMASELRLTPEQSSGLQAVLASYEAPRREIAAQKRRLDAEARGNLNGARDEERARALLAENARIRDREATLLREEEVRLLQVLSPSQVLALHLFREQLGDQIRGATNSLGTPSPWGRSGGTNPFGTPWQR